MAKLPVRKVDAIERKVFGWMWLIKVYKCRRSAIYSHLLVNYLWFVFLLDGE